MNVALFAFEAALILAGLTLLWRFRFSAAARAAWRNAPALPAWSLRPFDFALFAFLVVIGGMAAQTAASLILGSLHLTADARLILTNAAFQLGLLVSAAMLPLDAGHFPLRLPALRLAGTSGMVTFLISLPIVTAANLLWVGLLDACGLPSEQQDLLRLFRHAESPALLTLLVILAIAVAPVAEELLFRAMLFRYLRTRLPRWFAILGPAVFFASLHVNWLNLDGLASFVPLITLACVLSIAYERTGRISTSIVAHALFNLHTILLLFAGVGA